MRAVRSLSGHPRVLRPDVALTFHRHWTGRAPLLDDDADIFSLSPRGRGRGEGEKREIRPCAMCGLAIAPEQLVRLRAQKPVGPIRQAHFDEQSFPLHFDCLAAVSTTRFG